MRNTIHWAGYIATRWGRHPLRQVEDKPTFFLPQERGEERRKQTIPYFTSGVCRRQMFFGGNSGHAFMPGTTIRYFRNRKFWLVRQFFCRNIFI